MTRMLAGGAAAAMASAALAGGTSEIQIDLNNLVFDAGGAVTDTDFTGTFSISSDSDSILAGIEFDDVEQTITTDVSSVSGSVDLTNGQVTGGSIAVMLMDGSSYSANFMGPGSISFQAGQGFQGSGESSGGDFDDGGGGDVFAGLNVFAGSDLPGSFIFFSFSPNGSGIDNNVDLDLFVVPAPGAAAMLALGGLATLRRRR